MSFGETNAATTDRWADGARHHAGSRGAMARDSNLSDEVLVLVLVEALRGCRANTVIDDDGNPCRPFADHR